MGKGGLLLALDRNGISTPLQVHASRFTTYSMTKALFCLPSRGEMILSEMKPLFISHCRSYEKRLEIRKISICALLKVQ